MSSSSSSSGSSTTKPFTVGEIQTLPPIEGFVRADDRDGASDQLGSPEDYPILRDLVGLITR